MKTFIFTLIAITIFSGLCNTSLAQDSNYAGSVYTSLSTLPSTTSIYGNENSNKAGWKIIKNVTKTENSSGYIKRPYHNPNLLNELNEKENVARANKLQEEQINKQNYQKQLQAMCKNSLREKRLNHRGFKYLNQKASPRIVVSFNDYKNACKTYIKENKHLCSSK